MVRRTPESTSQVNMFIMTWFPRVPQLPLGKATIMAAVFRFLMIWWIQRADPDTNSTMRPRMALMRAAGICTARCMVLAPTSRPPKSTEAGSMPRGCRLPRRAATMPVKAVAAGKAFKYAPVHAHDLDDAGKAGKAAGYGKRKHLVEGHVYAGIPRSPLG
jgi:hypothetical protein